jgi:hypothetical protein
MYRRVSKQKRADGSQIAHLQFAESSWDPAKRRSQVRILYNFGRAEDPAVVERLRRLATSILKRVAPEEIVAQDAQWQLVDAWPYGDLYVLEALWQRLGIGDVIAERVGVRGFDFAVERALFAMVANRACAPSSKLYCHEQWLREDVRIADTEGLELHHLYRAMDFLEAHREVIEESLYYRLADLLNLDVDLVFYDTTSLHFEIDEADESDGVGNQEAGAKRYAPLRKRGKSKNRRDDAPQIVIGLAVTRDGLPVRHWVFPGNTVDVTTVERVKADLRGWRLNRCLFVGDAGMVSEANLKTLSRGGGRYILCMPIQHWTPHRICAHVSISVLALLLERVAEQACADTWRNIRDDLKQIKLAQLLSPNGTVWQVTEPGPGALNRLKSLKINKPPPILRVD